MLVAHARKQERDLADGPDDDAKGQAEVAVMLLADQAAGEGAQDNANVIGSGGKGGPAEFLEREQRRQQNGKRPQRDQREEDDLRELQRELSLRPCIALN